MTSEELIARFKDRLRIKIQNQVDVMFNGVRLGTSEINNRRTRLCIEADPMNVFDVITTLKIEVTEALFMNQRMAAFAQFLDKVELLQAQLPEI